MQFRILPVTPFEQNCTLLWCDRTRAAAILDPGGEADRILALAADLKLAPELVLLTHGHLDHVGASAEVAQRLSIPILGPRIEDSFWLQALDEQCRLFGFPPVPSVVPTRWLEQGEILTLGDTRLEVLHCPGHTPGHLAYFDPDTRLACVGDVLFRGSIGRTDFPRGNHRQLIDAIRDRLLPLGDDVRFIPGHGPMSTFGEERRSNPFIRG